MSPARAVARDHRRRVVERRRPADPHARAAAARVRRRRACPSRPRRAPLAPRRCRSGRRHPPRLNAAAKLHREVPRPRVEVGLEERRGLVLRDAAPVSPRASRRSPPGGERSRRTPSLRRADPRSSSLLPTPRKPARTPAASPRSTPANSSAASAAAAFRRLCSPAHRQLERRPARASSPRTAELAARRASESKSSSTSAREANVE